MKTTEVLARELVEEFCGSWSADAKARLVAGLVRDIEADPLKDLPRMFGRACAVAERKLFETLISPDSAILRGSVGERRAYSRGYAAGRRGAWPHDGPPAPPDEIVRELQAALVALRNRFDYWAAQFSADDDVVVDLRPHAERADLALRAVELWLQRRAEA